MRGFTYCGGLGSGSGEQTVCEIADGVNGNGLVRAFEGIVATFDLVFVFVIEVEATIPRSAIDLHLLEVSHCDSQEKISCALQ